MQFISAFAPHLAKLTPHFVADARPTRGSLFRIYKDTRFSSDKTPYKTHIGIHFSHEVGKDAHAPLFYLHLEPDGCFVAAGVWHPDSRALTKIRTAIVAQPEQWEKVTRKLELEGESLTRPPKGFSSEHPLDSGFEEEGLRGVAGVDGGAGVRPESHEGVHCGVPDDEAAGGIHDEGVGVEVLEIRHSVRTLSPSTASSAVQSTSNYVAGH